MIRTAIVTGALLLGFTTSAFAQQGPQSYQQGQQGYQQQGQAQSPMMGSSAWESGERERGPMGLLDERRMEKALPLISALANGTFYRFRRGEDEVDIHCPRAVQLQDCIRGATELMSTLKQNQSETGSQSQTH